LSAPLLPYAQVSSSFFPLVLSSEDEIGTGFDVPSSGCLIAGSAQAVALNQFHFPDSIPAT
jgi:hypothetical protein